MLKPKPKKDRLLFDSFAIWMAVACVICVLIALAIVKVYELYLPQNNVNFN